MPNAASAVKNVLGQLVSEREQWEAAALRTSNEQLYVLLQKCYRLYKLMEGSGQQAAQLRKGLQEYIDANGYRFTKSSHTLTKIVKCVFGVDRQRVSNYSIALRAALAQKIASQDVAAFISNAGGVQEIRLAKSGNLMTAKQKAAIASETIAASNLGVFSSTALAGGLDAGKIGTNTVLIGTWQADGTIAVRAVVDSDAVLNAALAKHYSSAKDATKQQAAEKDAATTESITQAAIDAAVAEAVLGN